MEAGEGGGGEDGSCFVWDEGEGFDSEEGIAVTLRRRENSFVIGHG